MNLHKTLLIAFLSVTAAQAQTPEPAALYQQHCAVCHAANRGGGMGPALLPENLERLKRTEALRVIAEGRVGTQMPAFNTTLNKDEIEGKKGG